MSRWPRRSNSPSTWCSAPSTLGFDPHPDFSVAKSHLGAWQSPSSIRFGLNDNPTRVIRTLDRSVGPGNDHFTTSLIDP